MVRGLVGLVVWGSRSRQARTQRQHASGTRLHPRPLAHRLFSLNMHAASDVTKQNKIQKHVKSEHGVEHCGLLM